MFDWTTAADGMFPLKTLNIIATNPDCKINQCNRCEGNCADDSDCAGNLKCWKRAHSHSTVPGCATCDGTSATGCGTSNYCYEPCPDGALPVNGCKNTFFSFDFTPTKALSTKTCNGNCGECEGNCASNSDCAANLKCWKRSYSHSNVPGCATGGSGNYCYKPCPNEESKEVPHVHGCRSNLRTVLRETAGCSVTDGTIDVWVNGATGANEVYDIISSSDMRLGGQLIMGGKNIVDVGSLQATTVTTTTLDTTDLRGTGVVDENNIKNGAVTTTAIRSNAVTSATIKNGAVTEAKIGTNAVSFSKIKNGAVTEAKIGTNAVTSAKINNGAVNGAKIASNAVGDGQLNTNSNFEIGNDKTFTAGFLTAGNDLKAADGAFHVVDNNIDGGSATTLNLRGWIRITSSPTGSQSKGSFSRSNYVYYIKNYAYDVGNYGSWTKYKISIDADGAIMSSTYVGASDRRIKKDIRPLKDGESLSILRRLDTVVYKYKDNLAKGFAEVIGFIAQDVNETIPSATVTLTKFIPDEMRIVRGSFKHLPSGRWEMKLNDTLAPGRYRFMMLTMSDNEDTVDLSTEDGSTFIVEKEYKEEMLLYGKEVDDFLAIDKQKIFAVAYSALQQVDKNQIALEQKVASLEETIAKLSERLAALDGQS